MTGSVMKATVVEIRFQIYFGGARKIHNNELVEGDKVGSGFDKIRNDPCVNYCI